MIPPLRAAGPVLDARGLYRLHHWLVDGKNTLVVGGGDANIAFINGNCIGPDGGFSLEAQRVRVPDLAGTRSSSQHANDPIRWRDGQLSSECCSALLHWRLRACASTVCNV